MCLSKEEKPRLIFIDNPDVSWDDSSLRRLLRDIDLISEIRSNSPNLDLFSLSSPNELIEFLKHHGYEYSLVVAIFTSGFSAEGFLPVDPNVEVKVSVFQLFKDGKYTSFFRERPDPGRKVFQIFNC